MRISDWSSDVCSSDLPTRMKMNDQPHTPNPASAGSNAAEHWFLRLQRGACSADERRAFHAWQQASPVNPTAYAHVAALYRTSADFAQDAACRAAGLARSEEPTSELQPLMRTPY